MKLNYKGDKKNSIESLLKDCVAVDSNCEYIGGCRIHHIYYRHNKTGQGYMLQYIVDRLGNKDGYKIEKVKLYNHEY